MRALVYALGGGLGHLQRSLALGRALARRGHGCEVLTCCEAWPRIAARLPLPDVTVAHLRGDEAEVAAAAQARVRGGGFDLLVVDTLPRGLLGELAGPMPAAATAFVHRDLTASYAARPEVHEAVQRFDLMLCPGERGPCPHPRSVETAPWVLLGPAELLPREAARRQLDCDDDAPLVVVCDATDPDEARGLAAVAEQLAARADGRWLVRAARLEQTWPLQRLHLGVDLLVGAAGYNTVHEARQTGTRLLALPRERLYDRQHRRLRAGERLEDLDVTVSARAPSPTVAYENGADAAAAALEQLAAR